MKYCEQCGRTALKGKTYCWYHDPATTEEEKRKARSKGGSNSRRRPHNLKAAELLPIQDSAGLLQFYNAMLIEILETENDLRRVVQLAMKVAPRLSESLALQMLESLDYRLQLIEGKADGALIDGEHKLLEDGSDYEKPTDEYYPQD